MSFTFNTLIPASGNNPSNDQPVMLANNVSNAGIWTVDHIGFNANNGGQHKQVTFNSKNVPGGLPTDPISILYTNSGTASAVSQLFYANQNGTFQISAIRSWALVDNTGAVIASQSRNVATVVRNSVGNFSVTLSTNAVSSSNFVVLVSSGLSTPGNFSVTGNYTITGIGTFNLLFTRSSTISVDPVTFSFQVLQI